MNPNSNWCWAVGYEDLYAVSDHAEVYSVRRDCLLAGTTKGGKGYRVVSLTDANGHKRLRYVHHLILEAFVGPRPPGMDGLHWDDDRTNDRLSNLYWGTKSQNRLDAVRNGRCAQAARTECPQGHPYTPENTRHRKDRPGQRECAQCRRDWRPSGQAALSR